MADKTDTASVLKLITDNDIHSTYDKKKTQKFRIEMNTTCSVFDHY